MIIALIILLVACAGFITKAHREIRFDFSYAFIFLFIETVLGMLLFFFTASILVWTSVASMLISDLKQIFTFLLLIVIIDGFLLFWINKLGFKFLLKKHSQVLDRVLVLSEYIIQWSLIYITIYQVIFANLLEFNSLFEQVGFSIDQLDVTRPEDLILLLFPALISIWMSIILQRHSTDKLA